MIQLSEMVKGCRTVRTIPEERFAKEYDVIVCGLGTAGALAALFCAENGLSVLGIERFTCVGGTHTAGGIGGHYFGCPGGHYEALDTEVRSYAQKYTCTTPESRKLLTEQALVRQGVELLYETTVCGVYLDGNCVVGLRSATQGKITEYGAKLVLDCTGEAVVAAMAGCKTQQGRETDGQMQPYSLVSMMYDGQKYGYTNVDFGRVNQFDPEALSQAVLFARSYPMQEGHAEKKRIAQMPILGIREGRRIVPEETACLADVFADKQTQTPMFYSYADLDKHGWDIAFDGEFMGDWAIGANLGAYNVTVAVPYQAILPKDYEGILVPCRALGVDRDLSSCVRMNLDMKKVAEVAAQWASLAIRQGKKLRDVSYAQLREKLLESGCLRESDNRGCRIDGWRNPDGTKLIPRDVTWITEPEKLAAGLKTETPGQAIWSARRIGETALPVLQKLVLSQDENTRKHAAFALAMLGKRDGLEILRKMVRTRDGFALQDCRKHNQLRGCMAIYWLGRLQDREIVPELINLICDEKELQKDVYRQRQMQTTRYEISDFEDVYYQFMSQAVMALIWIGNAHCDLRSNIQKAFADAFADDAYYGRITKRPRQSSEGNMVETMKRIAFAAAQRWQ